MFICVTGEVQQKNNYLIVTGLGESDGSTASNDLLQVSLDHPHDVSSLPEIPTKVTAGSAAAMYNNDTVFVTGIGESYAEIWKYSLSSAWTKCGSMLQDRLWHCTEFVGKQLFIMGGCPCLSEVTIPWRSIEAYSLARKRCEPVGKLKYGVKVAACVAYGDSIFVFGGLSEDGRDLDSVQVYNTLRKTVSVLTTRMPRPSRLMRAVVLGKYAILMGQHTCFLFDIDEKTWEERNQFKTDVSYFGLVLHNERVFVFGGGSTINEQNTWVCSDELKYVTVFNLFKDEFASWKTAAKLPKPALIHAYGVVTDTKLNRLTDADKDSSLE